MKSVKFSIILLLILNLLPKMKKLIPPSLYEFI